MHDKSQLEYIYVDKSNISIFTPLTMDHMAIRIFISRFLVPEILAKTEGPN
jgi:hypothetical protein